MKNQTKPKQKQKTVFFDEIIFEYPTDYFGQRDTGRVRCVNFTIKNITPEKLKRVLKEVTLVCDSVVPEYATIESVEEPKPKLSKAKLRKLELDSAKQRVAKLEERMEK